MKVAGDTVLNAPVECFSNAVLDPRVSVNTIPGCERLGSPGEDSLDVTVSAGVASPDPSARISSGLFGCKSLSWHTPKSVPLSARGTTQLTYDADAVVGGTVGGVGLRLLTSVGELISGTFFSMCNDLLSDVEVAADEILKGVVGAGLVLRGVGAGAFAGRRRDWRRLS